MISESVFYRCAIVLLASFGLIASLAAAAHALQFHLKFTKVWFRQKHRMLAICFIGILAAAALAPDNEPAPPPPAPVEEENAEDALRFLADRTAHMGFQIRQLESLKGKQDGRIDREE